MITEDYVSFEIAKLLKEKGFDGHTYAYYEDEDNPNISLHSGKAINWNKTEFISKPTLQMAMKWLREVHNISIEVVYDCSNDKTETISWWVANIKHINSGSSKENDCLTAYNSYEEAASSAIKYALENLM